MGKTNETIDRARQLRHTISPMEAVLWAKLRGRVCAGFKFRRQAAIGPFIVDFVCFEAKVIIELDGASHDAAECYDMTRTKWFELQDYEVVRFTNEDVRDNLEGVWESIRTMCVRRAGPLT